MIHMLRWQHQLAIGPLSLLKLFPCLQIMKNDGFRTAIMIFCENKALVKHICQREAIGFFLQSVCKVLVFLAESIQIYSVLVWPFVYFLPPRQNSQPKISLQNKNHIYIFPTGYICVLMQPTFQHRQIVPIQVLLTRKLSVVTYQQHLVTTY